ncbi:hypothetical protein SLS62_004557 [Diatrype stigma]|uniref:Uncharacterized protein n=1 Tax=Diatrype stigma TaxID=117547 RepID=A0AAN9YT07_9PEZI
MNRMEDQGRKRKADAALPETGNPSSHKHRKLYKEESPDIIVIEDDPPSVHPQESAHLAGRRKRDQETQQEEWIRDNKQRMKDIGNIVGNLRDQVTDWTLRIQQSETFFETLRVKIGDPPGTAWQEDMRRITSEEVRPLIERIERLENSRVDHRHQAKNQPPSTYDPSQTAFKSPFTQSDDGSTDQSTFDENLQSSNSTTSEDREDDKKDIATQHKNSGEKAEVQLDILSEFGISSAEAFWRPRALSNKGLKKLLQRADFRKMEHLRALSNLDDCTTPRDCILFCSTPAQGVQHDYILRTGTTATYVRDPGAVRRDQEIELCHLGLGGLRIHQLEIKYATDDPKNKSDFKVWKKEKALPKYVYDIGQLFLRRRNRDRYELNGTQYNIVIDITKPRKPVWLVMRPEYNPIMKIKADTKDTPFHRFLNGVGIAKIANTFGDLNFCRDPFDKASYVDYANAEVLARNTLFQGMITRRFLAPDIGQMEAKVMAGWGGTGPRFSSLR